MLFPDQVPSLVDSHFSCSFLLSEPPQGDGSCQMSCPVKPQAGDLSLLKFPESVNTSFTQISFYCYFLKTSSKGSCAGWVRALLWEGLGSTTISFPWHPCLELPLALFPCWWEWANPSLTFSAWVGLTIQRVTGMMGRDLELPVSFPSPQGISVHCPLFLQGGQGKGFWRSCLQNGL